MAITEAEVRELFEGMCRGLQAWIEGRPEQADAPMRQADDMTIFGPFGGPATKNGPTFADLQKRVYSKFHGGTSKGELVHWMTAGDLVVLVMVESSTVKFEGHDEPRAWVLRTTQVFRKDGDQWIRLHRHADPLIKRRSFDETLELAAETA